MCEIFFPDKGNTKTDFVNNNAEKNLTEKFQVLFINKKMISPLCKFDPTLSDENLG